MIFLDLLCATGIVLSAGTNTVNPISKCSAHFQGLSILIQSMLEPAHPHQNITDPRCFTENPENTRKIKLALNWKVTEWVPKLASNWVLMLTVGGLPVAFCTTRKSLVTISMTCPVWKTKSPFLFTASEERQPGIFACDLNSRVGDPCKVCEAQDGEKKKQKKEDETDRSHVEDSNVVEVWTQ